MERNGPNLLESDDQQDDTNRFNEIMGFSFEQNDDEDDDAETDGKKKKRDGFFGRLPNLLGIDKAEELEEPTVERPFALPFVQPPETITPEQPTAEDDTLVHPHHITPMVIAPAPLLETDEFTDGSLEDVTRVADEDELIPDATHAVPDLPLAEAPSEPLETPDEPESSTDPEDVPPVEPPRPDIPVPGDGSPELTMGGGYVPPHEHPQYATHQEVDRRANQAALVGVGAAIVTGLAANSRAKSRERKLERRTQERDEVLEKKLADHRREVEAQQAKIRTDIEARHRVTAIPEHPSESSQTLRRQTPSNERQTPDVIQAEGQSRPPHAPEMPMPRPLRERYNPEKHDHIPPARAFEQLTGMEKPKPQTPEQERRHEIMDDPSKVPTAYTQIDPNSPWNSRSTAATYNSSRSSLMNLSSHHVDTASRYGKPDHNDVYKKAAISGVITAAVILGVVLVITVFMH